MAKKSDYGSDIDLGSDAWNVADGYTKLKILRQLIMLDRWDTIAQFGTEELDEAQFLNDNQIGKRRVEALQRFHSTLMQLIGNVKFAIKSVDKTKMDGFTERMISLRDFIPKAYSNSTDAVTHEDQFDIDEQLFNKILEIMQNIKEEVNTPLNNAGLIFRPSEEVDLDKIMSDIIEGG